MARRILPEAQDYVKSLTSEQTVELCAMLLAAQTAGARLVIRKQTVKETAEDCRHSLLTRQQKRNAAKSERLRRILADDANGPGPHVIDAHFDGEGPDSFPGEDYPSKGYAEAPSDFGGGGEE